MRYPGWVGAILAILVASFVSANAEENGNPSGGWDFTDTVNIQESREWAKLYWEWWDTGVVEPEFEDFQFSNPIAADLTPIDYAYDVFEELYADEIASRSTPDAPYSVIQLVLDDPDVMQEFRTYTETGLLTTSQSQNSEVNQQHLILGAAAIAGNGYTADRVWFEGDRLCSQSLMQSPGSGGQPPLQPPFDDPPVPPSLDPFDDDLRDAVDDSGLEDVRWIGDSPGHPGFDCDDFASAMAGWLQKLQATYPDMNIGLLFFWWDGSDGKRRGHAVTIVRIGGYYYIIDPQTGKVKGPYPGTLSPIGPMKELICEHYGDCNIDDEKHREVSPDFGYPGWIPGEPPPWHTDPARKQEILDQLPPGSD